MQFRSYHLRQAQTQPGACPEPAEVLSLHYSLEPLQVLMRFASLARKQLPLATITIADIPPMRFAKAVCEHQLRSDRKGLDIVHYGFSQPLNAWQEHQLSQWHEALVPALANALTHQQALALAKTDPLTKLGNRAGYEQLLQRLSCLAQRHQHPFSLLLVDLDHFKLVNDRFGHQRGDAILQQVATVLKTVARTEDGCFRLGGDEFAVLLPDTQEQGATCLATRLLTSLTDDPFIREHQVGASIGLSQWQPSDSQETLEKRADQALYQAKADGRQCLRKG